MSVPDQGPLEKPLDPREAEYSVTGPDKTRGVRIHVQAFIKRHGQKHRQGRTTGKQVH